MIVCADQQRHSRDCWQARRTNQDCGQEGHQKGEDALNIRRPIVGRIRRPQPPLEPKAEVCDNVDAPETASKVKRAPKRAAKGARKNG